MPAAPLHLVLAEIVSKAVKEIRIEVFQGSNGKAVTTYQDTIIGDCLGRPGSGSFVISYDDITGNFNGTITFNLYCSDGVTLNGSASFSGKVNVSTSVFERLDISFNSLMVASGSDSFTGAGTISYNFMPFPATVNMNVLLRDNATQKVYKIENLLLTIADYASYRDVGVVSGRFYHPDYGYVEGVTTTALRYYYVDDWPTQGVVVLTGGIGPSGGPAKARLTVLSTTQYMVEADTNGDGTFDYNSGPLLWSGL